jgi:hypothetical protein
MQVLDYLFIHIGIIASLMKLLTSSNDLKKLLT